MTAKKKAASETAKKKRRSANVPGQFYGFSLQITRVVAHIPRARQQLEELSASRTSRRGHG